MLLQIAQFLSDAVLIPIISEIPPPPHPSSVQIPSRLSPPFRLRIESHGREPRRFQLLRRCAAVRPFSSLNSYCLPAENSGRARIQDLLRLLPLPVQQGLRQAAGSFRWPAAAAAEDSGLPRHGGRVR